LQRLEYVAEALLREGGHGCREVGVENQRRLPIRLHARKIAG
jgi:hypothetical protein